MRFIELALFLAPLAAYALWRMAVTRGQPGPPPAVLGATLAGLLVVGAGLAWFAVRERAPPGAHYVPATLRDGQVVPPREE